MNVSPIAIFGEVVVCGNVARRPATIQKGGVMPPHEHNFNHGTLVTKGELHLCLENMKTGEIKKEIYNAGDFFEVPSDWMHSVSAPNGPVEYSCFFAVRDEDGGVIYEPTEKQKNDKFNYWGWVENAR